MNFSAITTLLAETFLAKALSTRPTANLKKDEAIFTQKQLYYQRLIRLSKTVSEESVSIALSEFQQAEGGAVRVVSVCAAANVFAGGFEFAGEHDGTGERVARAGLDYGADRAGQEHDATGETDRLRCDMHHRRAEASKAPRSLH